VAAQPNNAYLLYKHFLSYYLSSITSQFLILMSLASWRSPLSRAIHRNRSQPHSRYLQLATVTPDGNPSNRTVVFRGFIDRDNYENLLQFVTDSRSEKIVHLRQQPNAEICWYFTKTREQFRIFGTIALVTADESQEELQLIRHQAWAKLSDAARVQFTWATPGKPVTKDPENAINILNQEQPVDNFCLLLLNPKRVDHLELKGDPQARWLYNYQSDRTWSIEPVNP
jgi:pyridoxamine 5'-phosphate oxidase